MCYEAAPNDVQLIIAWRDIVEREASFCVSERVAHYGSAAVQQRNICTAHGGTVWILNRSGHLPLRILAEGDSAYEDSVDEGNTEFHTD